MPCAIAWYASSLPRSSSRASTGARFAAAHSWARRRSSSAHAVHSSSALRGSPLALLGEPDHVVEVFADGAVDGRRRRHRRRGDPHQHLAVRLRGGPRCSSQLVRRRSRLRDTLRRFLPAAGGRRPPTPAVARSRLSSVSKSPASTVTGSVATAFPSRSSRCCSRSRSGSPDSPRSSRSAAIWTSADRASPTRSVIGPHAAPSATTTRNAWSNCSDISVRSSSGVHRVVCCPSLSRSRSTQGNLGVLEARSTAPSAEPRARSGGRRRRGHVFHGHWSRARAVW